MQRRTNLVLYLLLNIVVSAATTLAVLAVWDRLRPPPITRPPAASAEQIQQPVILTEPVLTPTLPPVDAPIIEITSIIGAGDVQQEVVELKRQGEGNLVMTGWSLQGENGSKYTFPSTPELTLYQDGAMQVYSRFGDGTPLELYWGRTEPAWRSGETVKVVDREGNVRAEYSIP